MDQLKIAPRSPWQSPYVERRIGTLRRECLDRVLIFYERLLHRVLREFPWRFGRSAGCITTTHEGRCKGTF